MDSKRDLIHLVGLLLSLKRMVMVNGDKLQLADEYIKLPRHARLQNMACSSRMKSTSLFSSWHVFIAREQICLKRLGISNTQCCRTPSYKSEVKRKRSSVRLVELLKLESIKGEKKGLCVYFLSTEIPVYTCWGFRPVMY
uniref:Uncharacterized protein n=1 Tax=Populus trichocarpa TaxID=3694 RepID=A0A2K1WUG2_POPTR